MKLSIQAVNFTAREQLTRIIEKRVQKLQRLCDAAISVNVRLAVDKQALGLNKTCGIRVVVPGYDLLSKSVGSHFEDAVSRAVEALERQIAKRKTRLKKQLHQPQYLYLTV